VKCRLTFNAMVYSKVNAKRQEKEEEMIADAIPRYINGVINKGIIATFELGKNGCFGVQICIDFADRKIAARKDPVKMRANFDSIPVETGLLMMGQLDAPAQRVECLDGADTFQPCTDLYGETVCEQVALYERDGQSNCTPTGVDAVTGAFALLCDMNLANSTQAMTEYHDDGWINKNPKCLERQEVAKGMEDAEYDKSTGKWDLNGTEVQTVCTKTPLIKVYQKNLSPLMNNDLLTLIPFMHPTTAKMSDMATNLSIKYAINGGFSTQELLQVGLDTMNGKYDAQIAQASNKVIAMKNAAHDLFNDILAGNFDVAGLLESFLSHNDVEEVANAIRAAPQFNESALNDATLLSLFGDLKQALKAKAKARLLL